MSITNLKDTLRDLLRDHTPDCLVSDHMHPWSLDVAKEFGVPRIVFHSSSFYMLCADDSISRFKPHEKVGSDTEPFKLECFPDTVEFTRLKIPLWHRIQDPSTEHFKDILKANAESHGVIINSFDAVESKYHEYCKNVMGRKAWLIGPVITQHSNTTDKSERNGEIVQDRENILEWLDSKEANSVLYVSFGSEARTFKDQFYEISHGLEASGHPFIWAARTNTYLDQGDEGWFPEGFEERMRNSKQRVIIKGWAPQQMILGHANVGAFMTHCGWNSCIEGLTNEVPMITWPLSVDQFFNESLLVDVLKVGIRVGSEEDVSTKTEAKATVTREKIEEAVKHMMGGEQDILEIRKRVKQYADESIIAVQEEGSSYRYVDALVQELRARQKGSMRS